MFIKDLTPEAEQLRKDFEFLRGSAVSSFANTEFLMKALLVKFDEKAKFPNSGGYYNSIESVVSNFKLLFKNPEIPDSLRDEVIFLMDNFEKVIADRNQFVHGSAKLNSLERTVVMKRFRPRKGKIPAGEPKYKIIPKTYDLDNMEKNVEIFDSICRSIISLILEIDYKLQLGILDYPISSQN